MIDRLAEVLSAAQPAEERQFLMELLRQSGMLTAGVAVVPPAQEETANSKPEEREQGGESVSLQEPFSAVYFAEQAALPTVTGQTVLPPTAAPYGVSAAEIQAPSPDGRERISALAALVGQAVEGTLSLPAGKQTQELSAVRELYHRAVEGVQTGLLTQPRPASVVIRELHPVEAGLTARELDRAVRRDSRRYDGAMHIY